MQALTARPNLAPRSCDRGNSTAIRIDHRWLAAAALREHWRRAKPFSHVVMDGFLEGGASAAIRKAFLEEAFTRQDDDVLSFFGSSAPPTSPVLRELNAQLASAAMLHFVSTVVGVPVNDVDMKAYVYLPASYLLPHVDAAADGRRVAAYAYYVRGRGQLTGGDLELFACLPDRSGRLKPTGPSRVIHPFPNRMVLFDASKSSLHQVREVLSGRRFSITGWFLS